MDDQKKLRSPILEIWRRLQGGKKGKGFLKNPCVPDQNKKTEDQKEKK